MEERKHERGKDGVKEEQTKGKGSYLFSKVIVDDKGIKNSCKEYMEKLMNAENEWEHKLSAEVKEGPADCIRMDEVRAALKKMKRHKAQGLSGLVAEMIEATGDIEHSGY